MKLNHFSTSAEHLHFEDGQWNNLKSFLSGFSFSKYFVLVDENTKKHCLPIVAEVLKQLELEYTTLEVKAGEESKSLGVCSTLWTSLTEQQADRNALLINLGGGMITDLGGFVASIYKRGIDFINLPTSLLAMIDASLGGKCGIDFESNKNQLGVFNIALATFFFSGFLNTLPKDELLSGYAEILKHALITDKEHWNGVKKLKLDKDLPSEELIRHSVAIKSRIVEIDPKEKGERRKLNFGHTIGHAIESYFLERNQTIPHGFAIAAGIICESFLSISHAGLSKNEFEEIEDFIDKNYHRLKIEKSELQNLMKFILQDKKNEGGRTNFTLLNGIGTSVINQSVTIEEIESALNYYFIG